MLNRAAVDIELQINGDTSRVRGIRDASGNLIYARDLIPNTLYPLLAGFVSAMQEYIITEHLASRPQDFQIACAVSVDEDLSAVAIADGTVSPVDSGDFLLPVYTDRSYIFIGVPTDAPDINSVLILGGQNIGSFTVDAGVLNYGTVPYKWTRTTNQVPPSLSGLALFVGTEDFY